MNGCDEDSLFVFGDGLSSSYKRQPYKHLTSQEMDYADLKTVGMDHRWGRCGVKRQKLGLGSSLVLGEA